MSAGLSAELSFVFTEYGIDGIAMGILSFGHLVGIILGLGTTLYLDGGCFLSIARNSWDGYRTFMSGALFAIATKYVTVGLGILWITGCGFLVHYAIFDAEKLANPKLLAKFALVSMLTVNGYVLHRLVFGRVAGMSQCGQLLKSRIGPICLFCGAVSSASWIGAFLLGALPILNNAVAFPIFVSAWAILVLVVYFCARVAIALSLREGANADPASSGPGAVRIVDSMPARATSLRAVPAAGYEQASAIIEPALTVNAKVDIRLRSGGRTVADAA